MKKLGGIRLVIAGALLAAYGAGAIAQVCPPPQECEPNYPAAQPVAFGADGRVVVNGVIGVMSGPAMPDQDLYSFYARAGDGLVVDIDNGIKFGTPGRSVQTILTLLGPGPGYPVVTQSMMSPEVDEGSVSIFDPYIAQVRIPSDGVYIVGVTGSNQTLTAGGVVQGFLSSFNGNGNYTLIISWTPAPQVQVQLVNIEVKPGTREFAPVNPKAKGEFPVALLSSSEFDALKVDRGSITFGATGDEPSMRRCAWEGRDVNRDGRLDLVCHVDNEAAQFGLDHLEGVLKGTLDGKPFKGRGTLKVLPAPKEEGLKNQKKQK